MTLRSAQSGMVAGQHFCRACRQYSSVGLQIYILSFRRDCGQWESSCLEREKFPVEGSAEPAPRVVHSKLTYNFPRD
jgi:hypothetical protein